MNVEQVKNNLQKVQDISAEIIDENLHIYPKNKDEVCKLLKWCNENKIPIVPKGSGSHIDEQVQGSVFISMKKMNKIIELSRADLTVSVEGGITIRELSLALKEYNFLLPVSFYEKPSSTIGGLLVRNAGGIEQYAYGTINDYLLGLEFVTPTGTLIKTGGKTVKNVSGYDFTRLFAKSWGTLGIITGATFKLIPMPQTKALFIISGDKIQEIISQMKEILLKRLSLVTFMVFDSSLVGAETERKLTGIFVLAGTQKAVKKHLDLIKEAYNPVKVITGIDEVDNYLEKLYLQIRASYENKEDKLLIGTDRRTLFEKLAEKLDILISDETDLKTIIDAGSGTIEFYSKANESLKSTIKEKLPSEKITFASDKVVPDTIYLRIKRELDPNKIMYPDNPRFVEVS